MSISTHNIREFWGQNFSRHSANLILCVWLVTTFWYVISKKYVKKSCFFEIWKKHKIRILVEHCPQHKSVHGCSKTCLLSSEVLVPHGQTDVRRSVNTLAVNVVAIALSGQQEHADVGRWTEVDEVEDAVFVRQSHYDGIHVLCTSCDNTHIITILISSNKMHIENQSI